jgi:Tol biopolymer transport system component
MLPTGTRLGRYEVLSALGEGGMGEVYRARDERLGRDVAIKILPTSFSADPDRLRRFEQEARATGALNHPNVIVVHDTGQHDGAPYVVYELLEGTTLRALLTGAPLPASRTIRLGTDIAAGLAAAHDRGIVHRDLKPENLFVTGDGRVKILDFGIASVAERTGPAADAVTKQATVAGMIVGTVGYMSPEQARGTRVDHRSDIFSLGIVLYEMLSGQRPFGRASAIETLNAILSEDPPDIPPGPGYSPPALERIIRHCLEKPPELRFQSARDVAFALEGLSTRAGTGALGPATPADRRSSGTRLPWVVATVATLTAIGLAAMLARRPIVADRLTRFEVHAPDGGTFQGILGVSSVISPDGSTLALAVTTKTGPRLFLRDLGSSVLRLVAGSEGASNPFWSPDSRSLGFFATGKMKRVGVDGGAPRTICDAPVGPWVIATWGADDTILVTGYEKRGVYRVGADGGTPVPILEPENSATSYGWPSFLPDGRHFLFYALHHQGEVRVGSLDSSESKVVLQGYSRAIHADPGFLLFVREGTLMAQPFDRSSLSVTGSPMPVAEGLLYFRNLGQADFSVSTNGVLAYQAGNTESRLVWFRRDGSEDSQIGEPGDYGFTALSLDETLVATDVMDRRAGTTDIQVFDLARGGKPSSVTLDPAIDWTPVFSPDHQQLAFASARRGPPHVHIKRLNDSSAAEQLVGPSAAVQFVTDWYDAAEGSFVVFQEVAPGTGLDLVQVARSGNRESVPLVRTTGDDTDGRVSPNGRWLAYVSTETGRSEVYVRALAGGGNRWPISTDGGVSPRWRRDGRELFYIATASTLPFGATVSDGRLMAVEVNGSAERFIAGIPKLLFPVSARNSQYHPTHDGTRFFINTGSGASALPVTVTVNWPSALTR